MKIEKILERLSLYPEYARTRSVGPSLFRPSLPVMTPEQVINNLRETGWMIVTSATAEPNKAYFEVNSFDDYLFFVKNRYDLVDTESYFSPKDKCLIDYVKSEGAIYFYNPKPKLKTQQEIDLEILKSSYNRGLVHPWFDLPNTSESIYNGLHIPRR